MTQDKLYKIVHKAELEAFNTREKYREISSYSFSKDCYQTAFLVLHFLSNALNPNKKSEL